MTDVSRRLDKEFNEAKELYLTEILKDDDDVNDLWQMDPISTAKSLVVEQLLLESSIVGFLKNSTQSPWLSTNLGCPIVVLFVPSKSYTQIYHHFVYITYIAGYSILSNLNIHNAMNIITDK